MARIFITGSADGLGQLAANALIAEGHNVVLHARNEKSGQEALAKVPGAERGEKLESWCQACDFAILDQRQNYSSSLKEVPPIRGERAVDLILHIHRLRRLYRLVKREEVRTRNGRTREAGVSIKPGREPQGRREENKRSPRCGRQIWSAPAE